MSSPRDRALAQGPKRVGGSRSPASYGQSGVRTPAVNERGDVCTCNEPYSSRFWSGPIRNAAFLAGTHGNEGRTAVGVRGADGNIRKAVI